MGVHVRDAKPGSIFALMVVLPMGMALSGVLTWSLFGNVAGAFVFLGLFVVGAVTENSRQRRSKARRARATAEGSHYIARLYDAARESGVDLSTPPPDT